MKLSEILHKRFNPLSHCGSLSDRRLLSIVAVICVALILPSSLIAQRVNTDSAFVSDNYTKIERMIPMRDGVRLFTSIYIPKDESEKYPFLIRRTPYSSAPYGENKKQKSFLGPNRLLMQEKYIFVSQDVRGRYKSEGSFEEMTPAIDIKKSTKDVDESSDTYDTVDWLLKNIKNNNGRVGIYGVSYIGFYASASLPDAHPAIKAVSPQAPMSDEFMGDDVHHNGAFFLMDNFDFSVYFLGDRIDSGTHYKSSFEFDSKDAYSFYKNLEPLKITNTGSYFNKKAKIWNEYLKHDTYDNYWKARNIRTHLKNIKPAVLIVGGWFDAEDLYGTLNTYQAIRQQSPANNHISLVMGPWRHGEWRGSQMITFPTYDILSQNQFFQEEIETKFFNYYLKESGEFNQPKATVFNTGTNKWEEYNSWPPVGSKPQTLYFQKEGKIANSSSPGFDEYISDPENPVPFSNDFSGLRNSNYVMEDQRFAELRKDVLTYKSEMLTSDISVEGPIKVDLFISSTGSDADFIVKLIDVLPDNEPNSNLAGIERLERAEVFRSKFRNSFEKPSPLIPGKITEIKYNMNDIAHTFKKGHRIMIQVQSTWFPLVDINPQKFVNINSCNVTDFKKATIHIYHNSTVTLPVMQ